MSGPEHPEVRFEHSDVDASALLKYGFWLVVTTAVVVVLLWRLYFVFVAREAARQPPPPVMKIDPEAMSVPLPNLQTLPTLDLTAFRAREESVLHSYGWVDKEAGIVRIPIEEAMRLVAERGLTPPAPASPEPRSPRPRKRARPAGRGQGPRGRGEAVKRFGMTLASSLIVAGARLTRRRPLTYPGHQQQRAATRSCARSASTRSSGTRFLSMPRFCDETGASVRLGDYFGKRPVVLTLVYFDCPMLCTISLNGLTSALDILPFDAGPGVRARDRSASTRRRGRPGRGQEEGSQLARYKRPCGRPAGTSSPADPESIRSRHEGGRLPLRLGRGDAAVRAPRGDGGR